MIGSCIACLALGCLGIILYSPSPPLQIHGEIAQEVDKMTARGCRRPNLTVVLVGSDGPSCIYVSSKQKAARNVGMTGEILERPATITQVGGCHVQYM